MSKKTAADNGSTLKIREEQLDISKRQIQTGEVTMHTEVSTEEKIIKVPVTHEELVIKKKVLDGESSNNDIGHTETIRIPISEEQVEVIKRPVVLEDVNIYKHQFHENKHIEETVKKEKVNIKTIGNPRIIDKNM
jgi:uncharacterized protein (TIGR02271 family)